MLNPRHNNFVNENVIVKHEQDYVQAALWRGSSWHITEVRDYPVFFCSRNFNDK